jgi:hypothetical protein
VHGFRCQIKVYYDSWLGHDWAGIKKHKKEIENEKNGVHGHVQTLETMRKATTKHEFQLGRSRQADN